MSKPKIIGSAYIQLKSYVEGLSKLNTNVLFVGETGSGKELFAQHYMNSCTHRTGEKRTQICTGTSDELLHSMIFGHEKGAFTDAKEGRTGLIETCEKGIIFLDELGDASEHFQSMILRVAEGYSYSKLGSDKEDKPKDVAFIAATSKPEKVREDLKYRFKEVLIPPLQKFDIPAIATHFFQEILKSSDVFPTIGALEELMAQDYPGNVRQLRRACEDLLVKRGGGIAGKKLPNISVAGSFDYERYKHEINTWDKHLKPIIDKYQLDIRYKYLPLFEETVHLTEKEKHNCIQKGKISGIENYEPYTDKETHYVGGFILLVVNTKEVLELMDKQEERNEEIRFKFKSKLLSTYKVDGGIPNLLKEIDHKYNPARERATTNIKPSFSSLLDLPLEAAWKEFKEAYLKYQLDKCSGDAEEAAKLSGHPSRRVFQQALSRAQKDKK